MNPDNMVASVLSFFLGSTFGAITTVALFRAKLAVLETRVNQIATDVNRLRGIDNAA